MLREARSARQLTQGQLAERLSLGQQAVSGWERGKSRPERAEDIQIIAALFPEHSAADWLDAAGYPATNATPTRGVPSPVQPLLDVLPLASLSPEQFQEFCAVLLAGRFPGATVNQYGGRGDKQDGIDLEIRLREGDYYTVQCKREHEFGPAKVRGAMRAHKVACDRAFILLSREATAAARKAVPKRSNKQWTLWDSRDIAREIRGELSKTKALELVDSFFPRYRRAFLDVDEPTAFESPTRYFAALLSKDKPFSHAWSLVGRETELASIQKALALPPDQLAIVTVIGPGGIGKTRIVRAAVETYVAVNPASQVLFLPSSGEPSPQDFELIGSQDSLLIIEDAHERTDLRAIFHSIARFSRPPKILITTRPYALHLIRGEAASQGLELGDSGMTELEGLGVDRAEEVAREILTTKGGPLEAASHIARITHDSPFALIVGSYLVATRRIDPATLNNVEEFRSQLLARFRDAVTGDIAPKGDEALLRDTLDLVALLRPVDPAAPSFETLASELVDSRPDKVRRAFQLLYEAGVLVKRGRLFRVLPELLGDYVVEQRCIAIGSSDSLGYVERALEHADAQGVSRIAVNISSLDWRLSSADRSSPVLADALWARIQDIYKADPNEHSILLEGVAIAAYYHPRYALTFYDSVRDLAVGDHEKLAHLLRNVAMHADYLNAACERLWERGKNDRRPLHQYPSHPIRLLKELAEVKPGKPVEYCQLVVEFAIGKLGSADRTAAHHSLFEVLDSALAVEGSTTQSRGVAMTITRFAVRRSAVEALRRRVIDFLFLTIEQSDPWVAARAVSCLGHSLRPPMNIDETQRADWATEFSETMRRMAILAASPRLEPALLVGFARGVRWYAEHGTEATKAAAWAVFAAFPQTLEARVTFALVDAWGHAMRRRDMGVLEAADEWQAEQRRIATELLNAIPDSRTVVEFLRRRIEAVLATRDGQAAPSAFVGVLVDVSLAVALEICEAVVANPADPLQHGFEQALAVVAAHDAGRAVAFAERCLKSGDLVLSRRVAWAYSKRLRMPEVSSSDLLLASKLIQSTNDAIVLEVLPGIGFRLANDPSWAIAALLRAPIERSPKIADEVFASFTRPGISLDSIDAVTFEAFLERLVLCPSLEEYWVQEFLKRAAVRTPRRLVELLIGRIEREATRGEAEFDALPYWVNADMKPDFRPSGQVSVLLSMVREWLLRTDPPAPVVFDGPKLYAAVAGSFDQVVLSDLDDWVKSGNEAKLTVVGRILREAPSDFIFEQVPFVIDLLERCRVISDKFAEMMTGALWASAVSGIRSGSPGSPFPQDEERRKRSEEALGQLARDSAAWRLYSGLKRSSEADIQWKREMDEELLED